MKAAREGNEGRLAHLIKMSAQRTTSPFSLNNHTIIILILSIGRRGSGDAWEKSKLHLKAGTGRTGLGLGGALLLGLTSGHVVSKK